MSRRGVVLVLATCLLGAVAVLGLAGLSALSAADALERARADLLAVDPAETSADEALQALRSAEDELTSARFHLDKWSVDVVARVPVVGRSLQLERAVARTASHVVEAATVLADRLPAVQAKAGGVDLAALAAVERDVDRPARQAGEALERVRSSNTALTPQQVGDARRDALEALGPVVATLQKASRGLGLMGGLLGASGDRAVLVMLQNNAELRGAGGYASSYATGRTSVGRLSLDPLQDVIAVADPPERARRVPAPPEYTQDYGPLSGDTTIWRSWNMSPHVPDSALVGARVAGVLLGTEPDVVVMVDVPAMARLAGLGDGVVLPDGSRVSPEELSEALLVDAYQDAGDDEAAQGRRRAELQAAATSTFTSLLSGALPIADVARTVTDLAAGRHVTAWSARPDEQATLVELDVAGAVEAPADGDLSHVSVNNVGGNKLDVYVARSVAVEAVVGLSEAAVLQRVTFRNEAPENLVPYVAGIERPGTVVSRVELSLPPTALDISATVDGRPWPGRMDAGAFRYRLPARVNTPRGGTSTVEVRYRLPIADGAYELRLIPQPLAHDAMALVTVRAVEGKRVVGDGVEGGVLVQEGPLDRVQDVSVQLAATNG